VTEAAPTACTYTVSPGSLTPVASGGSGTLTITTQAGCSWLSVSSVGWITVSGQASGSGTATYTVAANTTTTTRTGTILAGGKTISVTQAGVAPPAAPAAPSNVHIIGG
jgi:hypothetical protein